MLHTSTVHKNASLTNEGNSAYCQCLAAKTTLTYLNLWKLALRGHLSTDAKERDPTQNFLFKRTIP